MNTCTDKIKVYVYNSHFGVTLRQTRSKYKSNVTPLQCIITLQKWYQLPAHYTIFSVLEKLKRNYDHSLMMVSIFSIQKPLQSPKQQQRKGVSVRSNGDAVGFILPSGSHKYMYLKGVPGGGLVYLVMKI